jgi:hypothetical protein
MAARKAASRCSIASPTYENGCSVKKTEKDKVYLRAVSIIIGREAVHSGDGGN